MSGGWWWGRSDMRTEWEGWCEGLGGWVWQTRRERWVKRCFSSSFCPSAAGQWCVCLLYLDGLLIFSTGWRGPSIQTEEALRSLHETGMWWRMCYLPVSDLTDISFTQPLHHHRGSLRPPTFHPSTMIRKQRKRGRGGQSGGMCGHTANTFICAHIMGAATVSCGKRPLLKVSFHTGRRRAEFPVIKQDTLTWLWALMQ